jgi:hypothetical protein
MHLQEQMIMMKTTKMERRSVNVTIMREGEEKNRKQKQEQNC